MKAEKHWQPIGIKAHHGICVPLSSLRTKQSCGIGEFFDLLPLIDWCKKVGFDCLQLLPVNDTGFDPSFFNPISSCALDPIYLSLHALPSAKNLPNLFQKLNDLPRLARSEVKDLKMRYLQTYFQDHFATVSSTKEYKEFKANNSWLLAYASFKTLKEEFGQTHWNQWPKSFGDSPKDKNGIDFHCFVQYLSFSQMKKVRKAASDKGVFLKGDMPILISPDSADVWAHPHLFRLDLEAGAPPDAYNLLGQKWGFPLYNWDAMRQEEFAWWKQRLATLENFYHIYRIDHVVGFFRIWAIPHPLSALEGHFLPEDPSLWPSQGQAILEMMLDSCKLLPIAEDLGTIPSFIAPILSSLGICGTKMLRWQHDPEKPNRFIPYNQYEPLSMTTVSNADLDPLPLWWQKFPEESALFAQFKGWNWEPFLSSKHHLEILHDAHRTSSYFHINPLQEYLFPFPELVSANLEEERINIPGTQLPSNWTYRLRPYLEDLIAHDPLAQAIQKILGKSNHSDQSNL